MLAKDLYLRREDAREVGLFTRNPIRVNYAEKDNGRQASYWGRRISSKGEAGPWSLMTGMAIAARVGWRAFAGIVLAWDMHNWLLYLWFLLIVRPIARLFLGVSVHGREHLRFAQPTIFVANHNSHLDAAVLMDLMRVRDLHKVRPVAAADYFERGPIRTFLWTRCMNVLPIRRDNVTRRHNPLQAMLDALDAGVSLILFPEGTRGDPERLSEFKTGIAHVLAKRPHTPIVPVYMRNLGFAMPRGDLIIVPLFCDVFIGPPRVIEGGRAEIMLHLTQAFADLIAQAEALRPAEAPADDR